MKRNLLACAAAFLALAAILAGCDNPTENITTEVGVKALPSPENVRATAYPGIIIVSWDPVKDAAAYDVYRRDDETGAVSIWQRDLDIPYLYGKFASPSGTVTPIPVGTATTVVDAVGFDNQLVDGRSYSYTVVAYSGQSTSGNNGRATYGTNDTDLIWNGAGAFSVAADIPKRDDFATVLKPNYPTALNVSRSNNSSLGYGVDTLEVTWTAYPSLLYDVTYALGSSIKYTDKAISTGVYGGVSESDELLARAFIPLVGGPTTISVTGRFLTDYYRDLEPVPYESTLNLETLIAPEFTSVARDGDTTVVLKWNTLNTYENDTLTYTVYRAAFTGSGAPPQQNVSNLKWALPTSGVTLEAWAAKGTQIEKTGTSYTYTDTVDATKQYLYFLLAENTTTKAISAPSELAYVNLYPTAVDPQMSLTVVNGNSVRVEVDTNLVGAIYSLKRYTVTFADDVTVGANSIPVTEDSGADIAVASKDAGAYVFIDTSVPRRKYSRYALTVTQYGVSKTYYKNLESRPFTGDVDVSLSAVASGSNYKGIDLSFSGFSLEDADLFVKIWRSTEGTELGGKNISGITAPALTPYALISGATPIPVVETEANVKSILAYKDKDASLNIGTTYGYRIEVFAGTTAAAATLLKVVNNNKSPEEGQKQIKATAKPAIAPAISTFTQILVTGDNNTNIYHITNSKAVGAVVYKASRTVSGTNPDINSVSFGAITALAPIGPAKTGAILTAPVNVPQGNAYISITGPVAQAANTIAQDIYFVLDSSGLPHGVSYADNGTGTVFDSDGKYLGTLDEVLIVTRNVGALNFTTGSVNVSAFSKAVLPQ
jgi:hypothetical protein